MFFVLTAGTCSSSVCMAGQKISTIRTPVCLSWSYIVAIEPLISSQLWEELTSSLMLLAAWQNHFTSLGEQKLCFSCRGGLFKGLKSFGIWDPLLYQYCFALRLFRLSLRPFLLHFWRKLFTYSRAVRRLRRRGSWFPAQHPGDVQSDLQRMCATTILSMHLSAAKIAMSLRPRDSHILVPLLANISLWIQFLCCGRARFDRTRSRSRGQNKD